MIGPFHSSLAKALLSPQCNVPTNRDQIQDLSPPRTDSLEWILLAIYREDSSSFLFSSSLYCPPQQPVAKPRLFFYALVLMLSLVHSHIRTHTQSTLCYRVLAFISLYYWTTVLIYGSCWENGQANREISQTLYSYIQASIQLHYCT